jgi:hypothetical protein
MRSILCPIDGTATLDDRLETALALARTTNGHVTVQIANPFTEMAVWEPFGGAVLTADVMQKARAEDRALADQIDARLAPQDVPFDVVTADEAPIPAAGAAARFADAIVTSLADPMIEELVLGVRSPVLAVPKGAPLVDFTGPAMIAWDGSVEAGHAMRAALPLLRLASAVHLVTVEAAPEALPACEAAAYLSRHGVHAQTHAVPPAGTIAATLAATAARLQARVIVMGLFGHSRLRELFLGGVSRAMLDHATVPLLLAH